MADASRLEELRRRVQRDPASLVFAQLAEEHRRLGDFQSAVRVCRVGLARHPGYTSARVTLGRALLGLGQLDAAQAELAAVLHSAPENLAALRGLAEIQTRRGDLGQALEYYRTAQTLAPHDFEIASAVSQLEASLAIAPGSPWTAGAHVGGAALPKHPPALVPVLEAWLTAIVNDRTRRAQARRL